LECDVDVIPPRIPLVLSGLISCFGFFFDDPIIVVSF
jgi:hypothetical protein